MALTKDGNLIKLFNRSRELPDGTIILSDGRKVSKNPNMAGFLWQNLGKYPVIWENIHSNPNVKRSFLEGASIKVAPKEFVLLPHRYFIPWEGRIGNKDGIVKGQEYYGADIHDVIKKIKNKEL